MSIGRVTEGMMVRQLLTDLRGSSSRVSDAQRQIATGKRIARPSDDPLAAQQALRLRAEAAEASRYRETVFETQAWLETTDQALGTIGDAVQRVRELVVRAANGSMQATERQAVAVEVRQLVDQVKLAGNARYGDAYVLAGQQIGAPPYDPTGGDANAGDALPIMRSIGPGVSIQVNATAEDLLGDGGDNKLLHVLRNIEAHLSSGNPADVETLRTTDLSDLDREFSDVLAARTTLGALMSRLDAAGARLDQVEDAARSLQSLKEDVDYAEAILQLNTQQSIYEAALKTGANLIQPSLMDFLR